MSTLSESNIEQLAIEQLQAHGYQFVPPTAADGSDLARERLEDVLLLKPLQAAVTRLNPSIPHEAREEAIKTIQRLSTADLISNNEAFHRLLTEGIPVSYQHQGQARGDLVWLIDFNQPENNQFLVTQQFTVIEQQQHKRLDVVLFINGLPLVVFELKNASDENATLKAAYQQLQTYKAVIPNLFTYNALLVISDGLEARVGSLSASFSRFMRWKLPEQGDGFSLELETVIKGLCQPATLLDFVRHFIVFEQSKKEDPASGLTSLHTVKKLAAYHQYYAVNAAVVSTLRAAATVVAETPAAYGVPSVDSQPLGDGKAGVVWHTQGSGKSLSMVFYTGKIVLALQNPTVVVITDRNDLDDQLFDTFAACKQLLRQAPQQAADRQQLASLLAVPSGGVIFTTMQKFQPSEGNVYQQLTDRRNVVVIADEAHRTQYGFAAKLVDEKDAQGAVMGKKLVYGFAKYLRDALPNATYLGFTGTPIEKTDVNTPAVFGNYVDIYDIAQAVDDGATVRIFYESRLAKVALSEEGKQLIDDLDDELEREDLSGTDKAKAKWTKVEALVGASSRIDTVARDIVAHFEQRQAVFAGKAMIVTMSRRIAVALYDALVALRPHWHADDVNQGILKVVMTAASSDGVAMARHHTSKQQRKRLADRMKDPADALQLVIVRDMWLTGFDAPCLHTLYIDKPMQGHNLMQAIARVNRVYGDKPAGLVVDYLGIAADLKQALAFYTDAGGKGDPMLAQAQAVQLLLEKLEVVAAMFYGFEYQAFFVADTAGKLRLILAAEEHVLGLESGKKRFIDAVTVLSQAFAIAVPHAQALAVRDQVGFFQAVKARLVKFTPESAGRSGDEIETMIRQVVDQALVSEQVVDVFDAAGIKKPDISILSEEFLQELREYEHKNVALELLRRLLNDELKSRAKHNLVESRRLLELLEDAIRRYQAQVLTAAQVIDELISLSREIVRSDQVAAGLQLTEYEYAFYTAVASNESAQALMQQDTLRALAVVLFERVRGSASIDWMVKESVRAKLKVVVKRTLRQFGYPPDMELLAVETVLQQAELLAQELAG